MIYRVGESFPRHHHHHHHHRHHHYHLRYLIIAKSQQQRAKAKAMSNKNDQAKATSKSKSSKRESHSSKAKASNSGKRQTFSILTSSWLAPPWRHGKRPRPNSLLHTCASPARIINLGKVRGAFCLRVCTCLARFGRHSSKERFFVVSVANAVFLDF